MMQSFISIFDQMLFLFLCILIGFILRKKELIPAESAAMVSKLENYVCIPALILSITVNNTNSETFANNSTTIIYAAVVVLISCVIGYFLAPKLTDDSRHLGIFRYSLAFTNFGFMGQSVIQGVFGEKMLFAYFIFQLPAAIVLYTVGTAWLSGKKEKLTWRFFLNPTYIAMAIGMAAGFTGLKMPSFINKTVSGFAACYSPLAMLLTGIVIAKYDIRKLLNIKNVYYVTAIRLVLLPLLFYGLSLLFKVPEQIRILIMVYSAMPLGLYTIIIPEATGGDDKPGASMAVISNIVGLITVPLLMRLVM